MNLYIMRHAQTNYNLLGLCNDNPTVDVHLTTMGIQQAEQATRQLAHTPLNKIYVSQLPRTQQTAAIVNRLHNVPIITSQNLNDIRSGFDGKPVKEYFNETGQDRYNIIPPGGESVRQYQTRVLNFLEEVKQQNEQQILAVTHEEAMRVFYAHFNELTPELMLQLNFANCEVITFRLD